MRLWFDLLLDIAISLPREYSNESATPAVVAGDVSFQLLPEPSLNPKLLLLAGVLSATLLWACVTSVARRRTFPASFAESFSLQGLVHTDLALARASAEDPLPASTDRQEHDDVLH